MNRAAQAAAVSLVTSLSLCAVAASAATPADVAPHEDKARTGQAQAQGQAGQKIVIPISIFSDAQLGGYWTMRMASGLQGKGAAVTILLFTNGVRLADNRAEDDFGLEGETVPISKSFADFTGAGGKIFVESDYAKKIGLNEEFLRAGSHFADDAQMCDMILGADKVLSF